MPYLSNKRLLAEMSIALVMAIVATLTLEHSQIDLMVADWFYLGMGHWMVAKQAFLPDLLLYSGLKKLLMAMLIYLLVATICRAYHELNLQSKCNKKRSTHQLEYNFVSTQKPLPNDEYFLPTSYNKRARKDNDFTRTGQKTSRNCQSTGT
ncbi:phosphatase PAP2 family protein [Escherichia coli]|uniref:phosphatase PAP2 family protein n=1 Tax=Escherichia coli TaxID=562 RepID=UPI00112512FA|nr:phosphatase PAP2 family protein [Escherichia coli]